MVEMTTTKAAEALENMARTIDITANAMCVSGHTATAEDMAAKADALRLGAAALRESEWLDIAGAPKDGTPFDVWFAKEGRRMANVRWVAMDPGYFMNEYGWPLTGIFDAGWVTHYRPLPSPPKEQGNG